MIVHFFEPPAFQTIGGLNLAIRSLEVFLRRSGIDVRNSSSPEKIGESDAEEVAHFHGLWQPGFPSENFGLAILEALQVGTRVLTTNQTPWSAIASWEC